MTIERYHNNAWRFLDILADYLKQAVWSGSNDETLEEVKGKLEEALSIVNKEIEYEKISMQACYEKLKEDTGESKEK